MTTGTMKLNGLKIGNDPKTAAANIRIELRAAFPGVKFSVRVDTYTAIRINWNDGPTTNAVEAITNKYTVGSFDGMTDSYSYNRDDFNNIHGGVQYVFCRREYTPEFVREAAATLGEMWNFTADVVDMLATKYRDGSLWNVGPNGNHRGITESYQHMMNSLLCQMNAACVR